MKLCRCTVAMSVAGFEARQDEGSATMHSTGRRIENFVSSAGSVVHGGRDKAKSMVPAVGGTSASACLMRSGYSACNTRRRGWHLPLL